ncbi:hypothetical protein Hanom_Chr06g00564951 [Helianthus anomalus]
MIINSANITIKHNLLIRNHRLLFNQFRNIPPQFINHTVRLNQTRANLILLFRNQFSSPRAIRILHHQPITFHFQLINLFQNPSFTLLHFLHLH